MLFCVGGFGIFTILFGISHNLYLSMAALVLVGASDMVSVIIRGVLIQVATPDEMRGRVNAVDMVFIGASNQLGEAESGLTAHWFGTVPAVDYRRGRHSNRDSALGVCVFPICGARIDSRALKLRPARCST